VQTHLAHLELDACSVGVQHPRCRWTSTLGLRGRAARSGSLPVLGVLRLGLDEGGAELLAGLEGRIALGRDREDLASPWITALAFLPFLNDEATKSAKIYALVFVERFGNGAEDGLKNYFDLGLFPANLHRHYVNQLGFRHLFQCTCNSTSREYAGWPAHQRLFSLVSEGHDGCRTQQSIPQGLIGDMKW
jgi:hypothetical protein